MRTTFIFILSVLLKFLSITVPLLVAVAYFTIAERKIMAAIQRRRGPNVVGLVGILQPFADGLKLFAKETIIPRNANTGLFLIAPCLAFVLSLLGWAVIPFFKGVVICDINLGVLYLFAISSMNTYSVLLAGWASNSKYAFLGAIRSAAQMISYEVSIGLTILSVALCAGSFNLSDIALAQKAIWFCFPLLPCFIIFSVSMLAETNRQPFDLPEAESELVSGYNVEYSAMAFALFFLAEYANMLLMSFFVSILFLGGWIAPFWLCAKVLLGVVYFIVARAAMPRFRYDQLMFLGWKCFLPLSLSYFVFVAGALIAFDALPCYY